MNLWLDTETVGLVGNTKLIQFSVDDGPVEMIPLYRGWQENANTVSRLHRLFSMVDDPATLFIGFNASFDLFHLYRLRHQLEGLSLRSPSRPVQPFRCRVLDLQVAAMQNSILAPFAFQKGKARAISRVRRVPMQAVDRVVPVVTETLKKVLPADFPLHVGIHKVSGAPHLRTLSWTLEARLSLKGLMKAYGLPTIALEDVWPLPEKGAEKQWLPYPDTQVHDPVEVQCDEVMRNPEANFWKYSELDIWYLKVLYDRLNRPEPDHNSECAHAVAYTRYYGFQVDHPVLDKTITYYQERVNEIEEKLKGIDLNSPPQRLKALQALDPLIQSSAKRILKLAIDTQRPCADLAATMLEYGPSRQRLLQCQKVAECATGRAHPDLRVMGTPTGRMAGTAGLNWQGIGQAEWIDDPVEQTEGEDAEWREGEEEQEEGEQMAEVQAQDAVERKFKIGLRASILAPIVGDFASFEVAIAAPVYGDQQLQADLDAGVDLHSMAVATAHPGAIKLGLTYDQIRSAYKAHDPKITGWRKNMKGVVFGIFYGAQAMKVSETVGCSLHEAEEVLQRFYSRYPGIQAFRAQVEKRFCTADTANWSCGCIDRMDDEISDLLGNKRRWTFERDVALVLWDLGQRGIKTGIGGTVVRVKEKGQQTVDNAVCSALLGSTIAIQAAVSRQAGNHPIQSTGANLCKMLMAENWKRNRVPVLNIHDELLMPAHPRLSAPSFRSLVDEFTQTYRKAVPSLRFDWAETSRWSDK